jgi:hypothetical protein
MDEELIMASDYYYTTGPNAGQPKPGTRPETNIDDVTTGLPEGIPPQPDDYESVPYEYDPVTNSWVKLI